MGIYFQIKNNMSFVTHELEKEIEKRLKTAATLVQGEVKRVLSGSRHGRVYRVPATKRTYTASAPEEAPAVRLGALRQSYEWELQGKGAHARAIIGTRIKYSTWLEFGTSRMAPRPHLRVAFKRKRAEIENLFGDML